MNADRLLTLYEKVAEAPDAVPRLRRFVLDLAVRGKLVSQDAGDEPASELLKRISAEKARLVKAGEIKRPKTVDPVAAGEMAFATPMGWTWSRLADIAVCLDYMRKPINGTERDRRIEGKSGDELFPYFGATQQQGWIDDYIFDEELVLLGEDGVPFFDPFRSKAYIISGKTWVNNHAHVFKGILISHPFLANYLNVFDYTGRVVGATRSKLNQARAVDIPVPLPPLAEQRRIVAKVEELMALLDRMEAARAQREATRDRLTAASLARLTAPDADAAEFPANARFALATLPALTTRPDQIKPLRQTILNLAVRGKLVGQDPTDEPASELLKQIGEAKGAAKGRKGARAKGVPAATESTDTEVPLGWEPVRLEHVAVSMRYGTSIKCDYDEKHAPVLRIPNVSSGQITLDDMKYGPLSEADREALSLEADDLLMIRSNGSLEIVGRPAVVPPEAAGMAFAGYLVRLQTLKEAINSRYVWLALNSSAVRDQIERPIRSAVGLKNVNLTEFGNLSFWLPPIAEQHRIVAKVDALMALCDRLEAALTTTDTTRARLLEALLHEALDPATAAVTEAAERARPFRDRPLTLPGA
ncbi:restriction endonuclease subunit S [Salipiger sp.]|uniref:restriction endonuclease subunit S n=1 Tax=Salipiger sp. TaxID=2078585 RepID=UPI003A981835